MVDNDDKYKDDEENLTQVRSIIKQLNEEKPSQERVREVVTRADGSKMVRVTKKRRVMLTSADKRRRSRKQVLAFVAVAFVLAMAFGAFVFFRMSTMSGAAYLAERQAALQRAWGAVSVQLQGTGINGSSLQVDQLVAEFPEDSMLQRVELSGIQAQLDTLSFVDQVLKGEELIVEKATIVLRPGSMMKMPRQVGEDLWAFRRLECKDFNIQYGDGSTGPVLMRHSQAYMYYPNATRQTSVLMIRKGELDIQGWKTMRIGEAKVHVTSKGIGDFSISGTTDAASDVVEQRHTSFAMAGKMEDGASVLGPFAVESDNMSLADFTQGRFDDFLTARTISASRGKPGDKATISLSANGGEPVFNGEFHLQNVCLSSFPALMAITEHIEPSKRRLYNPISFHRGRVVLSHEGDAISLSIPHGGVMERDLAMIEGKMSLSAEHELSGEISYSIPLVLARVEYSDGHPDPIFQTSGEWAVLRTHLKGRGNMPGDDMAEVEARAVLARQNRPERIPFGQFDVNRLASEMLGTPMPSQPATPSPANSAQPPATSPPAPAHNPFERSDNPFETSEDPFAPSTPF